MTDRERRERQWGLHRYEEETDFVRYPRVIWTKDGGTRDPNLL